MKLQLRRTDGKFIYFYQDEKMLVPLSFLGDLEPWPINVFFSKEFFAFNFQITSNAKICTLNNNKSNDFHLSILISSQIIFFQYFFFFFFFF